MMSGGFAHNIAENRPERLIDHGDHFEGASTIARQRYIRTVQRTTNVIPREVLLQLLIELGVNSRQAPMGSTSTTLR
jgi:hypothetical protein